MPEYGTVGLTIVAVAFLLWTVFVGLPCVLDRPVDVPGSEPVAGRVCHAAPEVSYTPEEAHREMQVLINCDTVTCPAKHAAFWTVVDAGHATPDSRLVR